MNRKLAALTGAIALVGALAACSSSSSSTTAAATTSAAPKPSTAKPYSGTVTGTLTLNTTTGAATNQWTAHFSSPLGAGTGHDNLTFTLTGASTYTDTGTRTFVAADGDKLYSGVTGKGTFTSTTAHGTETDTITGGTGGFAGATGTYTDTVSCVVASSTAGSQTSHCTSAVHGQIRY